MGHVDDTLLTKLGLTNRNEETRGRNNVTEQIFPPFRSAVRALQSEVDLDLRKEKAKGLADEMARVLAKYDIGGDVLAREIAAEDQRWTGAAQLRAGIDPAALAAGKGFAKELRQRLHSMPEAERRAALLAGDQETIAAFHAIPSGLQLFTDAELEQARRSLAERLHPEEMARLDDRKTELQYVRANAKRVFKIIEQETGFYVGPDPVAEVAAGTGDPASILVGGEWAGPVLRGMSALTDWVRRRRGIARRAINRRPKLATPRSPRSRCRRISRRRACASR